MLVDVECAQSPRNVQSVFNLLCTRDLHITHKAPYLPPKILHSFLLGITATPREIENDAYAKMFFLGEGGGVGGLGEVQVAYWTVEKGIC